MKKTIAEYEIKNEESGGENASLFLSLYLVLLCFFILLNVISNLDKKKTNQSLESVKKTFAYSEGIEISPEQKIIKEGMIDKEIEDGGFIKGINKIAKENLDVNEGKISMVGNTLIISVPVENFFNPGANSINPKKKDLIKKIADEASTISYGTKVEMEFTMAPDQSAFGDPTNDLSIKRVAEFAVTMEKLGIPAENISAGINPDLKGDINLVFVER